MSAAEKRAKKVLDTIARDPAAWDAMTSLLNARALRDAMVDARKARGMTQAAVAKRMGVTQSTVSELESARYPDPRLTTLQRYARAIDCRFVVDVLPPPEDPTPEETP